MKGFGRHWVKVTRSARIGLASRGQTYDIHKTEFRRKLPVPNRFSNLSVISRPLIPWAIDFYIEGQRPEMFMEVKELPEPWSKTFGRK